MKEATCERAFDLIAFVYKEASESEARDFELHLKECGVCSQEVASFGVVRESITAWRDEALSGFVASPATAKAGRKSAIAALRQFFDLSPLWLKGATAFALVTFCVLAVIAVSKLNKNDQVTVTNTGYTQQDVDRMLKEALAHQAETRGETKQPAVVDPPTVTISKASRPNKISPARQSAKSRRPLSRAEREQLAADLRLLSNGDEAGLTLLGDRINQ